MLKGILGEESWTSIPSLDGFTGPILPSIFTSVSPEDLGVPRNEDAFSMELDPSRYNDTLFDHFDSWVTVSRLIGDETEVMPLPPSRRGKKKFFPPIPFNAESNWDVDLWKYVGKKWSITNTYFPDLIVAWSFIPHGHYSIYTSMGAVESPHEIKANSREMIRLAYNNPEELRKTYEIGVKNVARTLKGINEITGGKELIICTSDHNEALGEEYNGKKVVGHFHGMHTIPGLGRVPLWVNKKGIDFPDNMTQLDIKDFVVEMYERYEKNNPEYLKYKEMITQGNPVEQPENWNLDLTPEDEAQIKERLIKLGYLGETEKPKAKKQK